MKSLKSCHLWLVVVISLICGCNSDAVEENRPPALSPPEGSLLFQPTFYFANGKKTQQGTGFIVSGKNGEPVGVTSAHFLNFEGPQMLEAEWVAIPDENVAARFIYSLGPPGDAGQTEPLDLRTDYLILIGDRNPQMTNMLVLDERAQPDVGERIWFPNKDWNDPVGHVFVTGTVEESGNEYSYIALDEEIELQSQSGSPVISQKTGKVIGTLSRGGHEDGVTCLILCPAKGIASIIASDPATVELKEAVGKPEGP